METMANMLGIRMFSRSAEVICWSELEMNKC